jgi:hypothetical protein
MKVNPYLLRFFTVTFCGSLLGASGGLACGQVFTVDPSQSSVTISGTVAGGTMMTQGPGSLTAMIGGTIQVTLAGNTIQFSGQSQILVQTNGSWQPKADGTAGSEPADFGGQVSLAPLGSGVAALREIQLDALSPVININAGKFDSTNLTFQFPTNASSKLAYNVSGVFSAHGSAALTGYATNKVTALASLATVGDQQVLTIPVDATFLLKLLAANDTSMRLTGQLVAVHNGGNPGVVVQSIVAQNQGVVLQWQSAPGQQFQIQSSTDLANWRTNDTIVTPASGLNTWSNSFEGALGFFRLAK